MYFISSVWFTLWFQWKSNDTLSFWRVPRGYCSIYYIFFTSSFILDCWSVLYAIRHTPFEMLNVFTLYFDHRHQTFMYVDGSMFTTSDDPTRGKKNNSDFYFKFNVNRQQSTGKCSSEIFLCSFVSHCMAHCQEFSKVPFLSIVFSLMNLITINSSDFLFGSCEIRLFFLHRFNCLPSNIFK